LPAGDRFEDFHDKIGVTLEDFRTEFMGTWLFNYVEALQRVDIETLIVFFSARVDEPVRFRHEPSGCRVSVLPTPRLHRKIRALRWRYSADNRLLRSFESYVATSLGSLARELRRERCDVVLCQEYESARFDLCVHLGWLLGISVMGTYQGADRGHSCAEVPLRRLALRRCAGLIIPAAGERRRVRLRYGVPEVKLAATPNPVDVDAQPPVNKTEVRRQLGVPGHARVVIWHGRVQAHRKGLDLLVEAWRRVCLERPSMCLVLVLIGTGSDADTLRRDLATLPKDSFLWVGEYVKDRRRLQQYLSAADIAVLPSRHEGFSVAVIEAMAAGLPVIAADVDGVRDALGAESDITGHIIPPGDVDHLVDALLNAVDDTAGTAAKGRAARRRAEECFGLDSVGQQLSLALSSISRARSP
jgi:glycosyltransferase involved in cell wall biosynthesis